MTTLLQRDARPTWTRLLRALTRSVARPPTVGALCLLAVNVSCSSDPSSSDEGTGTGDTTGSTMSGTSGSPTSTGVTSTGDTGATVTNTATSGGTVAGSTTSTSTSTTASGGGTTAGSGSGGSTSTGSGGATTMGSSTDNTATTTGGSGGTGAGDDFEVNASAMAEDMGFGTNIGNTLENTTEWETGWGQPLISQAYIDGIASRGIKTVRVPVAWDTYANNGVIDAAKTSRVKEVVGMIRSADMYAIVNIHWDGGWIFNEGSADQFRLTEGVKTKFESYWHQIAAAFADVGHMLIFEGLNEEARFWVNGMDGGQPDYAALNELNQLFVTTVRSEMGFNKTRGLLIAGFQTDIELTCVDAFKVPSDPAGPGKLFLSLHYYTPYTFCGLDTVESWGSPSTTWGTEAEKAQLQTLFDRAGSFSSSRNIPVILGEFGVTPGENYVREPQSRTLWMTSVSQAALDRGIVPVLWDTGSEIARSDGSFSPEFEAVMQNVDVN